MATYRELHGKAVKTVTTNPTDTAAEGQIWFNSTENTFKSAVVGQAWSSGGPLSTGRYLSGSLGTQTAGVQIAGSNPPKVSNVEHYNGTGWSEETNYPSVGSSMSGAGTQTAGIAFGGNTPSTTANAFDYNGTAWTAANSLPYVANNIASCGLAKTSVIGAVGRDGSSGNSGTNKTVTFDGTNFANGPNINTTRMFNNSSGAGTGTAALIVGGFIDPSPNAMTNCEEYDGSSWTATGALNVATGFASAFGIQTNAVAQTNGSNYTATEGYNGSTWTTLPSMSESSPGGLYGSAAGSTGDAGWVSSMTPNYNKTEEFNRSTNVVTGGAFSSGGNLNTGRSEASGGGSQTAAIMVGGCVPSSTNKANVENYDGTSWSEGPDINTARRNGGGSDAGTQTAMLIFGGYDGSPTGKTEYWNGSSWAEQPDMNVARFSISGCGVYNSAMAMGGDYPPGSPPRYAGTESWNGSTWSTAPNLNTGRNGPAACGVSNTAALCVGGDEYPDATNKCEEYDGSSWTTGGNLPAASAELSAGGPQGAAMAYLGSPVPSVGTLSCGYDGTSWSTRPSRANGRQTTSAAGDAAAQTAGLVFGGTNNSGTQQNDTEEFTGETTAVNVKTITTS